MHDSHIFVLSSEKYAPNLNMFIRFIPINAGLDE